MNNSTHWQGTKAHGDAGTAPSPPAKEGCLARGPYP